MGSTVIALVISLVSLFAASVEANTLFVTGFEQCRDDSENAFWSGQSGTPGIATSWASSSDGSYCSLQINPIANTAEYHTYDLASAQTHLFQSFRLQFTMFPSSRCPIFKFIDSGTGKVGALVTIEKDATGAGRLSAFYENDGKECSAATNDGTECVSASSCDETFEGEATCSLARYGTRGGLSILTEYLVTLEQDNTVGGAGDVKVSLWVGTEGQAWPVGSSNRPQGSCDCAGDSADGYACGADADCVAFCSVGNKTCTTTDIVSIDRLMFGSDSTSCGQFNMNIDDAWTNDTVATQNFEVRTLYPNADGATNNWTKQGSCGGSHFGCVNEVGVPDDGTTRLETSTALDLEELQMTNIILGTGESLVQPAVALTIVGARSTVAGVNKIIDLRLSDGTNIDNSYADFDMDAGFSDNGWYVLPPFLADAAPDGSLWDTVNVNSVRAQVYRTSPATKASRFTKAVLDVPIRLADPVPPNVLTDLNGDGDETVCILGDSTWNDAALHEELVASIFEPDNLLECAGGGVTAVNVLSVIDDMLDGKASQCSALKGSVDKFCDQAFLDIGVNDFFSSNVPIPLPTPVGENATFPQWRDYGYCDDNGGADEGNYCHCNRGEVFNKCHSLVDSGFFSYVSGASWKSGCVGNNCVNESTPANPAKLCSSHVDEGCSADSDCSTGTCSFLPYSLERCTRQSGTRKVPLNFCSRGCLNANNCTNGLCLFSEPQVAVRQEVQDIYDAAIGRTCTSSCSAGTAKVNLILSAVPTASLELTSGNISCIQNFYRTIESYSGWIRRCAKAKGIDYIDLNAYFDRECPGQNYNKCMRDFIHWTSASDPGDGPPYGQELAAELITACLTNGTDNLTTHDGVCTASVCTAGLLGNTCSVDADCDIWSCTF